MAVTTRAIRAGFRNVRALVGFWMILTCTILAPLGVHRCQTAPEHYEAETACLNAATTAIFRWHTAGHLQYARTATGATASVRIDAAEWSSLTRPQQAAVCKLLRLVVWHGARVDQCIVQDESGVALASG